MGVLTLDLTGLPIYLPRLMEIYDQNVIDRLSVSSEIHSLAESHALHRAMIDLRTHLKFVAGKGEFLPHYRTERNFGWDITPGLFRGPGNKFDPIEAKEMEKRAIKEYESTIIDKLGKQELRDLFKNNTNGTNWDLLFQAQHCQLRTSLLDWTMDIAPSLFFGIDENAEEIKEMTDGQLWVFMVHETILLNSDRGENSYLDHDPFTLESGFMTNVPIYLNDLEERICEQRISRQHGRFYISPAKTCNIPMNKQAEIARFLFRFKIPAKYKATIKSELDAAGINKDSIYIKESRAHETIASDLNKKFYGF